VKIRFQTWHWGETPWVNSLNEFMRTFNQANPGIEVVRDDSLGTLVDFWNPDAFGEAVVSAIRRPWDRGLLRAHAEANSWDQPVEAVVSELRALSARR